MNIDRIISDRFATWLREVYSITPSEFRDSPASRRVEIGVAWTRYWRNECEHGRGVPYVFLERHSPVTEEPARVTRHKI